MPHTTWHVIPAYQTDDYAQWTMPYGSEAAAERACAEENAELQSIRCLRYRVVALHDWPYLSRFEDKVRQEREAAR